MTTAMLGGLLLLAGLALNPWALGRLLAPDGRIENTRHRVTILVVEVLLVAAGLVVLRMRRRAAPLSLAVVLALPLLAAAGLGVYGGVLALLPIPQEQKIMGSMERSEVLYLAVTPTLRALNQSAENLAFPDPGSHSLFADQVSVASDLEPAPEVVSRLDEAVLSHWPVTEGSRTVPKADLALWRSFFSNVEYLSNVKFAIVKARFTNDPETRWENQIHFAGLARLTSGTLAQVDAETLEATWVQETRLHPRSCRPPGTLRSCAPRSSSSRKRPGPTSTTWSTRSFATPWTGSGRRTSLHDRYVVEFFKKKTKPHEFFSYQDFDRHPGLAVVDIDADGLDDLYVMGGFGKNVLLRNLGDGGFREVAAEYGLDIAGNCSSAIFADFDNDGDPDLVLGRTVSGLQYLVNETGVSSTGRRT